MLKDNKEWFQTQPDSYGNVIIVSSSAMTEGDSLFASATAHLDGFGTLPPSIPRYKGNPAHFLRALLDFAPTHQGKQNIATEILKRETAPQLSELATSFLTNLIYPSKFLFIFNAYVCLLVKALGGKTPNPSTPPSQTELSEEISSASRQAVRLRVFPLLPLSHQSIGTPTCRLPLSGYRLYWSFEAEPWVAQSTHYSRGGTYHPLWLE